MRDFILILLVFFIFFRLFRKNIVFHVHRSQSPYKEREAAREEEGTIKIQKIDKKEGRDLNKEGDYIDYEEVK